MLREDWLPGIDVYYFLHTLEYRQRWAVVQRQAEEWCVTLEDVRREAFANVTRYDVSLQEFAGGFWRFAVLPETFNFLNRVQLLIPERMRAAARRCGSGQLLAGVPDVTVATLCRQDHPRVRALREGAAHAHAVATLLLGDPVAPRGPRPPPIRDSAFPCRHDLR